MWELEGFNAAYNAYEVKFIHENKVFGSFFNRIFEPRRYFYAKGTNGKDRLEALEKCYKWLKKINDKSS